MINVKVIFVMQIVVLLLSSLFIISTVDRFMNEKDIIKQIINLVIAVTIEFLIITLVDYRKILSYSHKFIYILGIIFLINLLVFVDIIGVKKGSSASWLRIFGFTVQPVEFMKLFSVFYVSYLLNKIGGLKGKTLKEMKTIFIVIGVSIIVPLIQHDFGTFLAMMGIYTILFFVFGYSLKRFIIIFSVLFALTFILKENVGYIEERFSNWHPLMIKPEEGKPRDFQLERSFEAIGSGQLKGTGIGNGLYKYLLPEAHNDFIFAIIAEEYGFLGILFFMTLYLTIIFGLIHNVLKIQNSQGFFISVGMLTMIIVYIVINLGVVLGFLPNTGLPLPLISYGGSNLLVTCMAIGIILNVLIIEKKEGNQKLNINE